VLGIASRSGQVVKGIAETLKALEAQKAKIVFLADDCDNEDYKATIRGLASQFNVPVVDVETWIQLKDYCGLGVNSEIIKSVAEEKGKEPKIKPRCSSAAIIVK
jgi:ribosomal protein L7Ae-like RNA K-turn-binding protein